MPHVKRQLLLAQSAPHLYAVVNDVSTYPMFLSGCRSVTVEEPSDTALIAHVGVEVLGIKGEFSTKNEMIPNQEIRMTLLKPGVLLQYLQGCWQFTAMTDQACKVELSLDVQFATRLLDKQLTNQLGNAATAVMETFAKRAKQLAGE